MHEIFISYRRVDTEASGGHLYAELCRNFGSRAVFMDTRKGGIGWGADFEKELHAALDRCEVLIALIGPQWARCERSPGLRRIDAPDDWVRTEIATALRRDRRVLPVRFQGASPLTETDLPPELRELRFHKRIANPISESSWSEDVQRLVAALATSPTLAQLHDLAVTETGIRLLEHLICNNPAVADAVSRSRAVIETTDREVDEIRLYKCIHDALHEVESKCLIPLRAGAAPARLVGFRRKFVQICSEIRDARKELGAVIGDLPPLLDSDLVECTTSAQRAFRIAAIRAEPDGHLRVIAALEALIGDIPVRLNDLIANAARLLELQKLQALIIKVVELLPRAADGNDELKPLLDSIDALEGLRLELALRVKEHGLLQSVDNCLRQAVGSQGATDDAPDRQQRALSLAASWRSIRRLRARFPESCSPQVRKALGILVPLEGDVESAIAGADADTAEALLADYANEIGDLFRCVDRHLKDFCFELREKTRPLKIILDMCRLEVRHA